MVAKITAWIIQNRKVILYVMAGVLIFVLGYKAIFPSPTTKETIKYVVDEAWKKTMTQKMESLTTSFTTQMATLNQQLSVYKQVAEDLKVVKNQTEYYDPNTGKLIKRILDTVSEKKESSSSTTNATTAGSSTATTATTTASTSATSTTDSGTSHSAGSDTKTTNANAWLSLYGGLGFSTFDTFKLDSANITAQVNLFGMKAFVMEDYKFVGQVDFKDRFNTKFALCVMEFKP